MSEYFPEEESPEARREHLMLDFMAANEQGSIHYYPLRGSNLRIARFVSAHYGECIAVVGRKVQDPQTHEEKSTDIFFFTEEGWQNFLGSDANLDAPDFADPRTIIDDDGSYWQQLRPPDEDD